MQLVRRLTQIACDLTHRDPGAPAPRPSALPPACRPDHEGRTDRVLTGIAERPVDVLWNTARHLAKGHDPVVPAAEPSERRPGHEQEPSL